MPAADMDHHLNRRQFLLASGAGLAGMVPPQAAAEPRDVIIDTDPGVDDAFALLLALRSPELRIRAVTVVAGNVPAPVGLGNALRMVEIGGRPDIPVALGAIKPLVRRLVLAYYAHGENGLGGLDFPEAKVKLVAEPATELIRRIVRQRPGQVSLITLGPLTNIALALRSDPELARMIPRLVLMGGSLSGGNVTPAAEFNIYVDPEAAHIVFHAGIPLVMVGLDVTRKAVLRDEHARALEAGQDAVSGAAARLARNGIERAQRLGWGPGPAMHDPLAVATFLDPTLVTLRPYFVDVETAGELTAGQTVAYRSGPVRGSAPPDGSPLSEVRSEAVQPNIEVAVDVDAARFFQMFVTRLSGKAASL
ncbi:MAG: nucleoside hydrolase [Acidobacteria bacterium]|nr:nucleoside hydrolase [Acidobacteriota bacterium]